MGKFLDQFPMRPALFVQTFQFIVTRQTQYFADPDMHQVLLFFLGENFSAVTEFLNADKEQDSIEVLRFFADDRLQAPQQCIPFSVKVEVALKHAGAPPRTRTPGANVEQRSSLLLM